MLPLLPLLLVLSVSGPVPAARLTEAVAPLQEELEAARAAVREAASRGSSDDRRAALEGLLAVKKGDVAGVLLAETALASDDERRLARENRQAAYALERKREVLAARKARKDTPAKDRKAAEKAVRDLEEKLRSGERRHARRVAWLEELRGATERWFAGLASGARKKAEKALWKEAEDHPDLAVRLGAIEMLGRVAQSKVVEGLVEIQQRASAEAGKVKRELVKLERDVRDYEARMQKEAEDVGGLLRGTMPHYNRLRRGASEGRLRLQRLGWLVDAAGEAAAGWLGRGDTESVSRSLAFLLRFRKKARQELRLEVLDILAEAPLEEAAAALARMVPEEKDPLLRAELLDALARRARAEDAGLFLAALEDANWHVRSRAAAGLARLRQKESIPVLIDRLEVEKGRTRSDVTAALTSLTGKRFRGRVELWRRFWEAEGADFEVPEEEAAAGPELDADERVGVTFFGIRTESQSVLFVLDVSGSMDFPLAGGERPAREGEVRRLDVAKQELVKAMGGLRDGAEFNLLYFAHAVRLWSPKVKVMDPETRSEVLAEIDRLAVIGGTNVYGALQEAFDLAGIEDAGEWNDPAFDTIYFLSDGAPSIGAIQDPRGILDYVRSRNRSAGIVIHCIGLGAQQDAYLLRSLALENGGTYVAR